MQQNCGGLQRNYTDVYIYILGPIGTIRGLWGVGFGQGLLQVPLQLSLRKYCFKPLGLVRSLARREHLHVATSDLRFKFIAASATRIYLFWHVAHISSPPAFLRNCWALNTLLQRISEHRSKYQLSSEGSSNPSNRKCTGHTN